jgi:hypothetical protein
MTDGGFANLTDTRHDNEFIPADLMPWNSLQLQRLVGQRLPRSIHGA